MRHSAYETEPAPSSPHSPEHANVTILHLARGDCVPKPAHSVIPRAVTFASTSRRW
jgi:hypothetical protein